MGSERFKILITILLIIISGSVLYIAFSFAKILDYLRVIIDVLPNSG